MSLSACPVDFVLFVLRPGWLGSAVDVTEVTVLSDRTFRAFPGSTLNPSVKEPSSSTTLSLRQFLKTNRFVSKPRRSHAMHGRAPHRELEGQLLRDSAQQRAAGLLGAEQDQLHGPVSPQEEALRQQADPHHAFQDPSRGAWAAAETNPQTRGQRVGRKGPCSCTRGCFLICKTGARPSPGASDQRATRRQIWEKCLEPPLGSCVAQQGWWPSPLPNKLHSGRGHPWPPPAAPWSSASRAPSSVLLASCC